MAARPPRNRQVRCGVLAASAMLAALVMVRSRSATPRHPMLLECQQAQAAMVSMRQQSSMCSSLCDRDVDEKLSGTMPSGSVTGVYGCSQCVASSMNIGGLPCISAGYPSLQSQGGCAYYSLPCAAPAPAAAPVHDPLEWYYYYFKYDPALAPYYNEAAPNPWAYVAPVAPPPSLPYFPAPFAPPPLPVDPQGPPPPQPAAEDEPPPPAAEDEGDLEPAAEPQPSAEDEPSPPAAEDEPPPPAAEDEDDLEPAADDEEPAADEERPVAPAVGFSTAGSFTNSGKPMPPRANSHPSGYAVTPIGSNNYDVNGDPIENPKAVFFDTSDHTMFPHPPYRDSW